MIVVYKETGWQVITQRAHGILAAQLGTHWKHMEKPYRWCETLLAIAQHDDAETELDGEHLLTESGGPLDYAMKTFDLQHCEKLYMLTITKSRYIALITSMHMEFLYRKNAKSDKIASAFLSKQIQIRKKLRKELGLSETACRRAYSLLEWCDAFSLILCKDMIQPEKRTIEISAGPDKKIYTVFQTEQQLTVKPWPFDTSSFEVHVEFRLMPKLQFSSSSDFRDCFQNTKANEMVWKICRNAPLPGKLLNKAKNA